MKKYITYGSIYKFICKCGNEWEGEDTGDGFCEACGEYTMNQTPLNKTIIDL